VRFAKKNYIPSVEDVLHSRQKTVGITEKRYEKDNRKLLFVDVGGQRNERRKWIHAFDNVTCIIFIVAISEYDQKLEEESTKNRMHESLTLFGDVINDRGFKKKNLLFYFFNKEDLFKKKNS